MVTIPFAFWRADLTRSCAEGLVAGCRRTAVLVTHTAELARLGLTGEMAFSVLDFWNGANLPPLTNEELRACISETRKSCRAPIERERARHDPWEPIPASQLRANANIDWIWEEFLPVGHISLLSSLPKVGKTTLLAHLLYLMEEGGELGTTVKPATVLVISEETTGLWRKRRDEVGLADHVDFLIRPFPGKPTDSEWNEAIQTIVRLIEKRAYSLVVFDTLSQFNPAADENDAARMTKALAPLRQISDAGAAVLLLHHLRKGDGGQVQACRSACRLACRSCVHASTAPVTMWHESPPNRRMVELHNTLQIQDEMHFVSPENTP